jgi:hypothetical protein
MFETALRSRPPGQNDLFPFWVAPSGPARIERHVPAHPYSKEVLRHENLRRALVLYRMVFGQNRQEDLVDYLAARLSPEAIPPLLDLCRVDLAPPRETAPRTCEDASPSTTGERPEAPSVGSDVEEIPGTGEAFGTNTG